MKKIIFASSLVFSLALSLRADGTNQVQLTDEKARVSYAIGLSLGHNFKRQELDLDPDIVGQAIKDVLTGRPEQLTEDQVKQTLDAFKKEYGMMMQRKRTEQSAKNKADGAAFLAANKNQPGVHTKAVVLPDGSVHELQYLIITNGTGPTPAVTDTVKVNYRGTLINGTEFDSSFKHGQPATFPVNKVIRGWTEALQLMPVGSKWKLFVPAELAYGDQSPSPAIPPGSVLIFEVELLSIQASTPPSGAMAPSAPLTSDIIKVPSQAEMNKGAKIEVIKSADAQKAAQSQ